MSAEWPIPPLRGPLGVREIFLLPPLAETLRARRERWISRLLGPVGLLLFGTPLWFILKESQQQNLREELWAILFAGFLLLELLSGVMGARIGTAPALYRRKNRFDELRLTPVRPVEICQILIHPLPRHLAWLWGGALTGITVSLLRWRPEDAFLLIPAALIALNCIVTALTSGWIHLNHALGLKGTLSGWGASLQLTLVYALGMALVTGVTVFAVFAIVCMQFSGRGRFPDLAVAVMLIPAALATWVFKFVLARAHAARLEQVVFPRMSG